MMFMGVLQYSYTQRKVNDFFVITTLELTNRMMNGDGEENDAKEAPPPAAEGNTRRGFQGIRTALLRVMVTRMQFFAPQAKRALAACVCGLPEEGRAQQQPQPWLTISVEAVGSGKVLVPALQVDRDATIGALRASIFARLSLPTPGTIRLLTGHGGVELAVEYDAMPLEASAVADGGTVVVAVVTERDTLMQLFESTGGIRWTCHAGWATSFPRWYGLTSNNSGNVKCLHLSCNHMRGACTRGWLL
jgi:hypothetical protein